MTRVASQRLRVLRKKPGTGRQSCANSTSPLVASALHSLGSIMALTGGVDHEVEPFLEDCLTIQRWRHDQAGLGESLHTADLLQRRCGKLGAARSRYEEEVAIMREIAQRNSSGYALDAPEGVAPE